MCAVRAWSGVMLVCAYGSGEASGRRWTHTVIGDVMSEGKWADCLAVENCPCRDCSDYVNEFGEKFEDIYSNVSASDAFFRDGGLTDDEWAAVEKWREVECLPFWAVNEMLSEMGDEDLDDCVQVLDGEELG